MLVNESVRSEGKREMLGIKLTESWDSKVEVLAGCDGVEVDQSEGIEPVHRREHHLAFHVVAVVLQ